MTGCVLIQNVSHSSMEKPDQGFKCKFKRIFLFGTAPEVKYLITQLQIFENYCLCKLSLDKRKRCIMHLPETRKMVFCCNANETRNKYNAFNLTSESHNLLWGNSRWGLTFRFANGCVAMDFPKLIKYMYYIFSKTTVLQKNY